MHIGAAGPPVWPDETTAIGTVALAFATFIAVIATILITRRDRENAAIDAKTEREIADARLDRQIEASASQLQVERSAADDRLQRQLDASVAQFQAEREALREQNQLEEAYLVQVAPGRMDPRLYQTRVTSDPDTPITCPCVIVVNRGSYTITDIQARFSPDGQSMLAYDKREHFSSLRNLPDEMRSSWIAEEPDTRLDTLTHMDGALRFSHDAIAEKNLFGTYPLVRWRDRWNQMWEYKLGRVRTISENEPWKP
jgi:hypothetical protein